MPQLLMTLTRYFISAMELCSDCGATTGSWSATNLGEPAELLASTTTTAAAAVRHQSAIPAVVRPTGSAELLHQRGRGRWHQVDLSRTVQAAYSQCCFHC